MVVENLRATGAIPDEGGWDRHDDKRRHLLQKMWGPWYEPKIRPSHNDRRRHLGKKLWEPWYESKIKPSHDDRRKHLGRCEGHDMSPITEHLRANMMTRYEWTSVWIANKVVIMSMKTNAGLTFIDIAPMLKINELEDICLGK